MSCTMNNNSTKAKAHCKHGLDPVRQATESFANVFVRAYLEASDEVRQVINDMTRIICDEESTTPEEREAALDTLSEAIYPAMHKGDLGVDIEDVKLCSLDGTDAAAIAERKAEEEATFATRLSSVMEKKGINQIELAERTGVGQSAISMMLGRDCRPQRRTIEKLADALSVKPSDLWPDYSD